MSGAGLRLSAMHGKSTPGNVAGNKEASYHCYGLSKQNSVFGLRLDMSPEAATNKRLYCGGNTA